MRTWQTSTMPDNGYVDIDDPGELGERKLYIEDDNGNMVCLQNEQIGELYNSIKPALAG